MIEWRDEPFELIRFLRNLPKIASSTEVIECSRSLKMAVQIKKKNKLQFYFGIQFWLIVIIFQFLYYILSITIFPKLKHF